MPLPEGYLPRKGDVLVIHATVKYDVEASDDGIHVVPGDRHSAVIIKRSDAIALHCKKWEPGDVAHYGVIAVEVIATDDDQVWIKSSDPNILQPRKVVHANELSMVPVDMIAEESGTTLTITPITGALTEGTTFTAATPLAADHDEVGF